jgi:hypothetical protein
MARGTKTAKPVDVRPPSDAEEAAADPEARAGDARLAASATRLVGQAVSVLEKELSAGIAAVRSLESRYTDVDGLRKRDPEDIMQRFRKDAHEVVDLLMDLVQIAASSAGGLAQRMVRVRGRDAGGETEATGAVPSIESGPARPGQSVTVSMALENAGNEAVEAVNFISSDLVTSSGLRIGAADVVFEPDLVTIAPKSRTQVRITIRVPTDAAPGTYSGMLVASKLEQVRAVLSVAVTGAQGEHD